MNIALISYFFNDHHAEGIVTSKLARALVDAGHTVTVFGRSIGRAGIIETNNTTFLCHNVKTSIPRWWNIMENIIPQNILGNKLLALPRLITCSTPEDFGWILNVKKIFIKSHEKRPFDLIHTRLNPHSSHQVALQIRKTYAKIPWCAYFSDPWPPHKLPHPFKSSIGILSKMRMDRLMGSFLKDSGSLVFTSPNIRDYLLTNKHFKHKSKSFVARHLSCYWQSTNKYKKSDILKIRHAGILNRYRDPNNLFEGIRSFLKINKNAYKYIKFEFMGRNHAGLDANALEPPIDLQNIVNFYREQPIDETWKWIIEADVLLLLEFNFSEGIFFYAKLADYLHARRPIFAISPNTGVAADLLKEGGGVISSPDDPQQISNTIGEIYNKWNKGTLTEIAPSQSTANLVHPDTIIPIYEKAFQSAIINNK